MEDTKGDYETTSGKLVLGFTLNQDTTNLPAKENNLMQQKSIFSIMSCVVLILACSSALAPKTAFAVPWQMDTQSTPVPPFGGYGAQGSGKLWAFLGADWPGSNQVYSYDPTTGFEQLPDCLYLHWCPAVTFHRGAFYVIAGGTDRAEKYVPGVGWTEIAPIPESKSGAAAAVLGDRIYVFAGYYSLTTFIYDPMTNTWTSGSSMNETGGDTAAAVVGDRIYAMGGLTAPSSDVGGTVRFEYLQAGGSWVQVTPGLPIARGNARAVVVCDDIYLIGGRSGDSATVDSQVLKCNTLNSPLTWTSYDSMLHSREWHLAGVFGRTIYVLGGRGDSTYHNSIETNLASDYACGWNAFGCSEYLLVRQHMYWEDARLAAEAYGYPGHPAHLACITTAQENQSLGTLYPYPAAGSSWVGGFQTPEAPEPSGGWQWVSGEPWAYTDWQLGEPNDDQGEDWLQFSAIGWNDQVYVPGPFIVERLLSPDSDGDGDGIPDCVDDCPDNRPGLAVDCNGRPLRDCSGDCNVDGLDLQCIVAELLGQ